MTALDSIYNILPDTSVISSILPHPPETNLWVEPYELMCEGPPWFNLGADSIPFGANNVNWQSTYYAALENGLVASVASGTRMILESHSIHRRRLLPKLCRCAWDSITMFLQEALGRRDVFPGGILVPQTSSAASGNGM